MNTQSKFGLTWRWTGYCRQEIQNFREVIESIPNYIGQRDRYDNFLRKFVNRQITKDTLVDIDLIGLFIEDLENRAQIDYIEREINIPEYIQGGKRFLNRAKKLRKLHPTAVEEAHEEEKLEELVGEVQLKQAQERIDLQKDLLQVQLELFKNALTEKPINVAS
mgnify:FL=1